MTVDEMLRGLAGAYPAFNTRALEAWGPIFRARFSKREGPHLAAAYAECLGSFDPKTKGKLFPTPPDIEAHMPSLRADSPEGPAIRDRLDNRRARAALLLADWTRGQGAKIKAQRAPELYAACWLEAFDQSIAKALDDRVSGIRLDQVKINECFQRAISTERVKRNGRPPAKPQAWWQQVSEIATAWGLEVGSSRVDLQACKLEYSIVSPK